MFSFLKELLFYKKELHPANTFCKALEENFPNIYLSFFGLSRHYDSEYSYCSEFGFVTYCFIKQADILKEVKLSLRKSSFKEAALSSQVIMNGEAGFRIPMFDFIGKPSKDDFKVFADKLSLALPELSGAKLFIYNSGNSYHGYVSTLITDIYYEELKFFLEGSQFIDQEWIRLGMMCLRWTKGYNGRMPPSLTYTLKLGNSL